MAFLTTNDIIGLVLVYGLIIAALIASLIVEKKLPNIDSRKVVHIGVGNFVFVWWIFTESWVMLAFFTIPFAVILFLAMFRGNAISESKLGELTRKGRILLRHTIFHVTPLGSKCPVGITHRLCCQV